MDKNILIFTTLFFNRVGNQSMLESVRHYARTNNVYLVTGAEAGNSYYLSDAAIADLLPPRVKVIRVPTFYKTFAKRLLQLLPSREPDQPPAESNISVAVINQRYGRFNILSHYVAACSLFSVAVVCRLLGKIPKVDAVCGYEIGGMIPAKWYRRMFGGRLFCKLQGTTLTPILEDPQLKTTSDYSLDHSMYKLAPDFDVCIMTNDGTAGNRVLAHYGVEEDRILFPFNGVSGVVSRFRHSYSYIPPRDNVIKLCMVSRIIGWKRVHLGVEVMAYLVNDLGFRGAVLDIYGHGDELSMSHLGKLIVKYNIAEFVKVHGALEHEDVPATMVSSDFLVSLYNLTNITNPLIEAAYLCLPIISISQPTLLDAVGDEAEALNIYLFEEQSEAQLVRDVAQFLSACDITQIRKKRTALLESTSGQLFQDWEQRVERELAQVFTYDDGVS